MTLGVEASVLINVHSSVVNLSDEEDYDDKIQIPPRDLFAFMIQIGEYGRITVISLGFLRSDMYGLV